MILAWGKCQIKATPIEGSGATIESAVTFPTPVDGTTQLTTTQGDKTEAKIEGGGIEAVRFNKNTYELAFDVRLGGTRTDQMGAHDGLVDGEFQVEVKSLDYSTAPSCKINRSTCNVQVSYTSAVGFTAHYVFISVEPSSGDQITFTAGSSAG